MGSGKPRGLKTARKLRTKRRVNRWADKGYKKAHFGTWYAIVHPTIYRQ
jgi:small subunit ribosomal protein S23e